MSLSDNTTMLVQPYTGNNGGMFGTGNNDWWILLLFLWGGYGGYGGFGGGFGGGAGLQGIATRADINEGFALNNITGGIQAIQQGICDATYNLNNTINSGFHNQTVATMQGFNGIQQGLNGIGHQISDCCCQTSRAIDSVNFNMAKGLCDVGNMISMQTRDIVENANANYRGLMDFLVQEKLSAKDAKIAELQNRVAISDQNAVLGARIDAATAELIRRTGHDCPVGAYLVNAPTPVSFPVNACGQVQFGGNGCGCGGGNGFGG